MTEEQQKRLEELEEKEKLERLEELEEREALRNVLYDEYTTGSTLKELQNYRDDIFYLIRNNPTINPSTRLNDLSRVRIRVVERDMTKPRIKGALIPRIENALICEIAGNNFFDVKDSIIFLGSKLKDPKEIYDWLRSFGIAI